MENSNLTIEVLKKAGWYENRKIDIADNLALFEEKGFDVFEKAKEFIEEFGELNIVVERQWPNGDVQCSKHSTYIKEYIGMLDYSDFDLTDYVKERVIQIGSLYNHAIQLFISESGKIFESVGFGGDTSMEAFDNIICEKGIIIWDLYNK